MVWTEETPTFYTSRWTSPDGDSRLVVFYYRCSRFDRAPQFVVATTGFHIFLDISSSTIDISDCVDSNYD